MDPKNVLTAEKIENSMEKKLGKFKDELKNEINESEQKNIGHFEEKLEIVKADVDNLKSKIQKKDEEFNKLEIITTEKKDLKINKFSKLLLLSSSFKCKKKTSTNF